MKTSFLCTFTLSFFKAKHFTASQVKNIFLSKMLHEKEENLNVV